MFEVSAPQGEFVFDILDDVQFSTIEAWVRVDTIFLNLIEIFINRISNYLCQASLLRVFGRSAFLTQPSSEVVYVKILIKYLW